MNRRAFIEMVVVVVVVLILINGEPNTMIKPSMTLQGWIFPDKAIDATSDIIANKADVLKPEYYTLNDDGTLRQLTTGFNAYSATNVALVKAHSKQQFVTVSGGSTGMGMLTASRALTNTFVTAMLTFLQSSGFTGVEIDFEDFGSWTAPQYAAYQNFIKILGNALHAQGYKLMVDGPAISDNVYQGYYLWKYEDMNNLPIDAIVAMAYDYMYDQGVGTPVAPLEWIAGICQWMTSKISDPSRIVIGLNSYGYHSSTKAAKNIIEDTYEQSMNFPGFSTAVRDSSSGEMMWSNPDGSFYDYSDSVTLQGKLNVVQSLGIPNVSVWHLGGNQWFSQASSPQPTPQPSLTFTADQIKAVYDALTPSQVTTILNAIKG